MHATKKTEEPMTQLLQHSKSHFLNKASNYILHFGPYTLFHKWFLRAASRDDEYVIKFSFQSTMLIGN